MNQKTAKQIRKVAKLANLPPGKLKRDWLKSSHSERGQMRPRLQKAAAR